MDFLTDIQAELTSIRENGGVLYAQHCERICRRLSIKIEDLMVRLLPLSAMYSKSPISSFSVGAVALGEKTHSNGMSNLYLGANFEYANQALCHSVHAEQSAISNAWLHDESSVRAIAVSSTPCGHCRQFLYEIVGSKRFPVLLPNAVTNSFSIKSDHTSRHQDGDNHGEKYLNKDFASVDLSQLLPSAFGPADLGCNRFLMDPKFDTNHLKLNEICDDELVNKALYAANLSYAPYTNNFAGCALKLSNGQVFTGRYAENVAHNPSLSPLSSALCKMTLSTATTEQNGIERVVLVESATKTNHRKIIQNLVTSYTQGVELEYYSASSIDES